MFCTAARSDVLSLPGLASKRNSGAELLILGRMGGSYLDVGCCQPNNLVPPPEPNTDQRLEESCLSLTWFSLLDHSFFDQLLTSFVFQLQVANLLSNVFKLLMTHKVRSCDCLPSIAGSSFGEG